jgi:hypothetical protein
VSGAEVRRVVSSTETDRDDVVDGVGERSAAYPAASAVACEHGCACASGGCCRRAGGADAWRSARA